MNKEPQVQTRCVGRVITAGVGDQVWRGSNAFAGSGIGGAERKGSQTYDSSSLAFRKLNNADPGPKNG